MGGGPDMGNEPDMNDMPPMDGGPDMGNESGMGNGQEDDQFDFSEKFDPGVEADEDTDPKHFIQQLTGKLSQSLNTYDDDSDEGLFKYVGKMILKQVAKNLDGKGRKELIKTINMADEGAEDDDYEETDDDEMNTQMDGEEDNEEPMNESFRNLCEEIGLIQTPNNSMANKRALNKKSPFSPKCFRKQEL